MSEFISIIGNKAFIAFISTYGLSAAVACFFVFIHYPRLFKRLTKQYEELNNNLTHMRNETDNLFAHCKDTHDDFDQNFKELVGTVGGSLTHYQAERLTELYLSAIKYEFELQMPDFIKTELPNLIKNHDEAGAKNRVDETALDIITKTRNKVAAFNIKKNYSFQSFINQLQPLDSVEISEAQEAVRQRLVKAIKEFQDKAKSMEIKELGESLLNSGLASDMKIHINIAINKSEKIIKDKIMEMYGAHR